MSERSRPTRLSRSDRLGIIVSSVCLVHCLALPFIIAMLPFIAAVLPPDGWVHPLLLGLALPITGFALLRGHRHHHGKMPLLFGLIGLGLIGAALFSGEGATETWLTVGGGLFVSFGHILNWRAFRPVGAPHQG